MTLAEYLAEVARIRAVIIEGIFEQPADHRPNSPKVYAAKEEMRALATKAKDELSEVDYATFMQAAIEAYSQSPDRHSNPIPPPPQ